MSSKTKTQKPAAQKPEAETGVEVTAAQAEATTVVDEPAAEAAQADAPAQPDAVTEAGDPALRDEPEAESTEPVAVIETVAAGPATAPADGLSTRLTRTVNAMLTSGKPEAVHALHKVELITGTLKTSLPAAIEACDAVGDEGLKADLKSLHAFL